MVKTFSYVHLSFNVQEYVQYSSVADLNHVDLNQDAAFHFDANPDLDPTFCLHADPAIQFDVYPVLDPAPHQSDANLQPLGLGTPTGQIVSLHGSRVSLHGSRVSPHGSRE